MRQPLNLATASWARHAVSLYVMLFALLMSFVLTSASQAQLANTKIAFHSSRDGNNEIYVMNSDGSNQTRLTNNAAEDSNPSWSPDGTKIACASDQDLSLEKL